MKDFHSGSLEGLESKHSKYYFCLMGLVSLVAMYTANAIAPKTIHNI